MNDQSEVRDYLDRMADGDPYGPVHGGPLLNRGRRGRRNRRLLATGGAAAATVAVLAVTTSLLSGPGAAQSPGPDVAVAGSTGPTRTLESGSPGPTDSGAPRTSLPPGAASEVVSEPEALRRCRVQWGIDTGRQIPPIHLLSSQPIEGSAPRRYRVHTSMWVDHDDKPGAYDCSIPAEGENRPGRILDGKPPKADPAMFADPSADDATVLRACSAILAVLKRGVPEHPVSSWGPKPVATDLTGWRVMARSKLPRIGTVFIALSPRGDLFADCEVYPPGSAWDKGIRSAVYRTSGEYASKLAGHLMESGGICGSRCKGFLVQDTGQVPVKVTRLHVKARYGGTVDVPVNQGWYALLWANGDPQKRPDVTVTAYDAAGNVVRPG